MPDNAEFSFHVHKLGNAQSPPLFTIAIWEGTVFVASATRSRWTPPRPRFARFSRNGEDSQWAKRCAGIRE